MQAVRTSSGVGHLGHLRRVRLGNRHLHDRQIVAERLATWWPTVCRRRHAAAGPDLVRHGADHDHRHVERRAKRPRRWNSARWPTGSSGNDFAPSPASRRSSSWAATANSSRSSFDPERLLQYGVTLDEVEDRRGREQSQRHRRIPRRNRDPTNCWSASLGRIPRSTNSRRSWSYDPRRSVRAARAGRPGDRRAGSQDAATAPRSSATPDGTFDGGPAVILTSASNPGADTRARQPRRSTEGDGRTSTDAFRRTSASSRNSTSSELHRPRR